MIKKLPLFAFYLSLLLSNISLAQDKLVDKTFYLVDSLNISKLNDEDQNLLDSCLTLYRNSDSDTIKILAIERLINDCIDKVMWEKYHDWLHSYLLTKLNSDIKNTEELLFVKRTLVNSFNIYGFIYKSKGKTLLAIDAFKDKLIIEKEINDKKGMARSYNNIGYLYKIQGNILLALDNYNISLKLKQELEDEKGIAYSYNNLGSIYQDQGKHSLAFDYLNKGLIIFQKIDDKPSLIMSYNNIGRLYSFQEKDSLALDFFNKGLKIAQEAEDKAIWKFKGMINSYANIGKTYVSLGKKALALDYFRKGLNMSKDLNFIENRVRFYSLLANIYNENGAYSLAQEYGEEGLKLAQKIGLPREVKKNASLLGIIAEKKGNYKKAFRMYKLEVEMRDSILNKENYRAIIEQKTEYEYEKKKVTDSVKSAEAEKIHLANLNTAKLENEKKTLQVVSQRKQNIYLYICLFLAAISAIFLYSRYKVSQRQRNIIEHQKIAVEQQKEQIETQHLELEETHKEINDSIRYAEQLQLAIFPSKENLDNNLNKYFVLFKPKDVVSGDFYWLQKIGAQTYFAVADCTGHGVPGAMVSVVCSNSLNRSVKEFKLTEPKHILNKTRELVIETFAQSGKDVKDGMDITLCSHLENENKITFSGANNPLWIVRETKYLTELQKEDKSSCIGNQFSLVEYKANKQPVGLYAKMTSFNQIEIKLFKNDTLYLFTDGYADQFGGENNKKFKSRAFKKLLLETNKDDLNIQKKEIDDSFNKWKGELEQLDDVCVVGIKV